MRYVCLIVVFGGIGVFTPQAFAQSGDTEMLNNRVQALENQLQEIKELLKNQVSRDMQKDEEIADLKKQLAAQADVVSSKAESVPAAYAGMDDQQITAGQEMEKDFYLAKKSSEMVDKDLGSAFGGVYTKPFLRRFGRNTYLGGYMDFEFRAPEDEDAAHGFTQKRFIPFIYSDISDRVKLATEIEFEFGGVGGGRSGEVILEFGTIDFLVTEWINWRGGYLLTPLGKFNLVHDSPILISPSLSSPLNAPFVT